VEVVTKKRLMIFSGSSYPELAREVADHLGMRLGEVERSTFANGERYVRYLESVRGADAFVIQSHVEPVNAHIMEQLIMIDALKRASAKRICAVVPCYGYARSDKKTLSREPIAAKLLANLYVAAGADRVMSVDLHTGQIQGFFNTPFDHLTALPLLTQWCDENVPGPDRVVVSPDAGRVRLIERFADHLHSPIAILHKRRTGHNVAEVMEIVGEVDGKTAILVDDMIDTAGTICGAAHLLKEHGATRVVVCATHPVLSGPAAERLRDSDIETVVVTNTLPIPDSKRIDKLVVLSIAPLVASAVKAVFEDESVSQIFQGENT